MAPPLACSPSARQRLLLHAAADGDLRIFKGIVSRLEGRLKEAVEAMKDCGAGALHEAAGNGRTAMCAYLVEELQVDINAIGATPLVYAVLGGIVDTVSIFLIMVQILISPTDKGVLLMEGAHADLSSDCGTPLHVAAMKSYDGCMKILLDHHADAGPDIKSVGTFTPLIAAATEGLTDFYKCLLEAGADPIVPDEITLFSFLHHFFFTLLDGWFHSWKFILLIFILLYDGLFCDLILLYMSNALLIVI
uniref:Uncharacterized protein n=1 Tax=Oryza punctata TaxID=4537 RepID=A0A0E0JWW2_ORYPU